MVFCAAGDVADKRTQATPEPNVLTKNIDDFTERWQKISPKLMSSKTLKEISNLKKHIDEGCLSAIPPGHGTNRNEALHRYINPYFHRTRLSVQVSYTILHVSTVFFSQPRTFRL